MLELGSCYAVGVKVTVAMRMVGTMIDASSVDNIFSLPHFWWENEKHKGILWKPRNKLMIKKDYL
ncbi:MAG: hypothetical protein Q9M09_05495, partial [Mariprofundaceae bacterium]|nr:hypothetical protein [Mariprofundaceae bacterium]